MNPNSLESLAAKAVARVYAHQLQSDDMLSATLETQIAQAAQRQKSMKIIWAGMIAVILFTTGVVLPFAHPSIRLAFLVVGTVLSVAVSMVWGNAYRQAQSTSKTLHLAKAALVQKAYKDKDLKSVFRTWSGDLSPLSSERNWEWENISSSVAEHPILGPVWVRWLLSSLPIRESDADLMSEALRAEKDVLLWRKSLQDSEKDLQAAKALALSALPATLVNEVRAEQLDEQLPPAEPELAPKARF